MNNLEKIVNVSFNIDAGLLSFYDENGGIYKCILNNGSVYFYTKGKIQIHFTWWVNVLYNENENITKVVIK